MSGCSSCSTCASGCDCGTTAKKPTNNIKNVIGVMSGKGGVGKSTTTVLLAKTLASKGYKVGVMDADITGPSIPRLMNLTNERAYGNQNEIYPVTTEDGIKVISLNLMNRSEDEPVVWRGPIVGAAVGQFWTDVVWGDLDYLLIDMPPGTGDVALTVMQTIPIKGLIMVSIPQDMVSMIVAKAVNMSKKMNVKILGIIENMSYIICPCCDEVIKMDEDYKNDYLSEMNLDLLAELPMTREISKLSRGVYDDKIKNILSEAVDKLIQKLA